MSALHRFEHRLPDVLDELAPTRVPDYLDDLLATTARTRQRPAWASLERWLPVSSIARSAPFGMPSWRPILLLAVVAAAILALAAAFFAGAPKSHLPAPFGPARNGLIFTGTPTADIAAIDPATGKATTIVRGSGENSGLAMSNDGTQLLFDKTNLDGRVALWVVNADGSGARELVPAGVEVQWAAWSPDGKTVGAVRTGLGQLELYDVKTGAKSTIAGPAEVQFFEFLPDGRLLLFSGDKSDLKVGTAAADGSGYVKLPTAPFVADANYAVSPDGKTLVYMTWADAPADKGALHAIDLATGKDTKLTDGEAGGCDWMNPGISPDGTLIKVDAHCAQLQVAVIPIGGGTPRFLGAGIPDGAGTTSGFSPDGTQLIVRYDKTGEWWLYPVAGGDGRKLSWKSLGDSVSWQRLAIEP